MANEMFTQLPQVSNASMTDIICAVQGYVSTSQPGLSVQETLQQVFNLFNANMILTNAGNPNGSIAGQTYQLLWDSADKILWICTTTGTSTTTVWSFTGGTLLNGQLMVGSSGASPVATAITAGTGISVTNGAGSITIAATGAAGITWSTVTSNTAMLANNGYITNNAGRLSMALPTTAGVGSEVLIQGLGAGGWIITQAASQAIHVGSVSTTVGVGGTLASTNQFDSIRLVCVTANLAWCALGAPQSSGLTIV